MALAADAFSVGASVGLLHRTPRQLFRLSFHFGLFQSLLALAGALTGTLFLHYVEEYDHWIAFGLLSGLGAMMIYRSLRGDDHEVSNIDLTKGMQMIGLSIAVSIDAFAAGVGLPTLDVSLAISVSLIGVVAGVATLIAMLVANHVKNWIGKRIEIIAGLVL
ncbi:MAG: manganese efflux pump MntP family protein, partial [bacterium]|nr:manganese efflux pump MntP family protein [bacterium]